MARRDWNDFGGDLNRIIENAVHMRSFGNLNNMINETIQKAFGSMDDEFRCGDGWDFDLSGSAQHGNDSRYTGFEENMSEKRSASGQSTSEQDASRQAAAGARSKRTKAEDSEPAAAQYKPAQKQRGGALFAGAFRRSLHGVIMLVIGIIAGCCSVTEFISLVFIAAGIGAASAFVSVLCVAVVTAVIAVFLIFKGCSRMKLSKRFGQHVRSLDGDEYIDIGKLAAYCHRPEDEVKKEIKKMLKRGWFVEGHLDSSEKCLIVSNAMYQQYLDVLKKAELQKQEEAKQRKEQEERNGGITPDVREILDRGNEYIESIHKSNDAIPGEKISEKIYRMELLVKRIFKQTELHPEKAKDLRRLMEYYLPMTVKLLQAYEELDGQPVQGENIESSKKEIEDTLDTLNVAFEKLLDRLFQDTAWDVAADISVLQTMLAQEGLTEDDLTK